MDHLSAIWSHWEALVIGGVFATISFWKDARSFWKRFGSPRTLVIAVATISIAEWMAWEDLRPHVNIQVGQYERDGLRTNFKAERSGNELAISTRVFIENTSE